MSSTKRDTRRTGIFPLAYMGVEPEATPYFMSNNRAPNSKDKKNFQVGDLWLDRTTLYIWILGSVSGGSANWIRFAADGTIPLTLYGDTGTAVPDGASNVNIFGSSEISTSAATNTFSIGLDNGTDGQILVGATGLDPAWTNITSTGATVVITNGANSINLETVGGSASLDQFTSDSGTALPIVGVIYLAGGTNINTSAIGDTVTVALNDDVSISGTLTLSYLGEGVVQTTGAGLFFSDGGTDGQLLIGATGAAPAWANITSTGTTITVTNGANSINLEDPAGGGGPAGPNSAFLAYLNTDWNPPGPWRTPFGLPDPITTLDTVTEVFDLGNDITPGGAGGTIFTSPQTGSYHLTMQLSTYQAIQKTGLIAQLMMSAYPLGGNLVETGTYELNGDGLTFGDFPEITLRGDFVGEIDMGDTMKFEYQYGILGTTVYPGGTLANMTTFMSGNFIE